MEFPRTHTGVELVKCSSLKIREGLALTFARPFNLFNHQVGSIQLTEGHLLADEEFSFSCFIHDLCCLPRSIFLSFWVTLKFLNITSFQRKHFIKLILSSIKSNDPVTLIELWFVILNIIIYFPIESISDCLLLLNIELIKSITKHNVYHRLFIQINNQKKLTRRIFNPWFIHN